MLGQLRGFAPIFQRGLLIMSLDESANRNIELIKKMRENPCPEGDHEYTDHIFATDSMGIMMHVICSKCLDMQGWIYR